jgi:uncharacterized protein YicC (UPF0701 family)
MEDTFEFRVNMQTYKQRKQEKKTNKPREYITLDTEVHRGSRLVIHRGTVTASGGRTPGRYRGDTNALQFRHRCIEEDN